VGALKRKKSFPQRPDGRAARPAAGQEPVPAPRRGGRPWVFRLIALALPLVFLALLELVLRLAGFGYPTAFFLKSEAAAADRPQPGPPRPVWIENQQFGWRFFPRALARTPEPLQFPCHKDPKTCRIFILGESAALGDPAPDYGFSRVLEVLLRARYPGVGFEVVNVAMTAINSHVIREIARDCTRLEGDLWIIYMGNNEVVGPYGAGTVFTAQAPGLSLIRASIALKGTRLGQCLEGLRPRRGGPVEWEGMEMFLRQQVRASDPKMNVVYRNFAQNLEDILRFGAAAGAPVLLSTVVVNLKDSPPFASLHQAGLGETALANWWKLYDAGTNLLARGRPAEALASFQDAARIDAEPADLHFVAGQCLLQLGQLPEACSSFARALDLDTLRFRADLRINRVIRQAAQGRPGVTLLDAADLFARQSPQGLPGGEFLYEHVHLNFEGNCLLARSVAERIEPLLPAWVREAGAVPPPVLSDEECARRLALTDWNRLQVAEEIRTRLRQPPFVNQFGQPERDERWRQVIGRLKQAQTPEGLQQAAALARAAVQEWPFDWRLRSNLGKLLEAAGDTRGAAAAWQMVRRLLPHEADPPFHLGNLAQPEPGLEVADYFKEALRLKPDAVEVLNGLGLLLASEGQTAEAIRQFEEALRIKPRFIEARVNLGQVLAGAGRPEAARQQYEAALGQDTNCLAAHINLGKLCSTQGAKDEAARHYREALRIDPDHAVAHFNLGNALTDLGEAAGALEHYVAAVRAQPDFAEARCNLGQALARQGRVPEALEQFAAAVRLKPEWVEARFNLGVALARERRLGEAALQFREVLRLQPGHPAATRYLDELAKAPHP
jgi:tetratricopeptide (TPR) repeat protein